MALAFNDLTQLDQATVQSNLTLLTQLVQDAYPNLTVKRGAIYDIVLMLSAILGTNDQLLVQQAIQSLSLAQINANPALADPTTVANVLSNYRITANLGSAATGRIQIITNTLIPVTVPVGTVFAFGDVTFTSNDTYTARTNSAQVLSSSDVLITALGNGLYAFTIGATATAIGTDSNITRGTQLTTTPALNPVIVAMVAFTDFTGGVNADTNLSLVNDLENGAGLKAVSNRMTTQALLLQDYPSIVALSEIGYSDAEMFRDQHTIWPGSMGGRVDIYARTQLLAGSTQLGVTAALVGIAGTVGTWQFSLDRNAVPGFYEVARITQTGQLNVATGYAVTSDIRGLDLSGDGFIPDIANALEGAYSRYQTSTIQFMDTDTDASGLTLGVTRAYDIAVTGLGQIAAIQATLNDRGTQWPAGDVLVKAPVPCFVTITLTVQVPVSVTLNVPAIQQAAADSINALAFPGTLAVATVSSAINSLLAGGIVSSAILQGRIRRPDGTDVMLTATDTMTVPDDPDNYVTARTVTFFAQPTDVNVNVVVV